ncbi:hypothetical protein SLEP1_g58147 [Rubroshorea leprosula]|uniref:Mechanosensitive ion channel protein n=1 Tax=Rubroshorea leprosula TaxID=152421 RepID=A0AAV5MSF7_9ROSI|nr:hypothetical protein SLEP1_g58147 [Rubroshorea leprosula]
MEPGIATAEKNGAGEVVLEMSKLEEAFVSNKEGENPNALSSVPKSSFSMNFIVGSSPKNLELAAQQENLRYRGQVPTLESSSSTKEIASPKPEKPPPSQKKSLAKSSFSKPKSRLKEPNSRSSGSSKYSTENSKSGEEDEDDEENPEIEASKKSGKWTFWVIIEWIVFVCTVGCLIASLTLKKLESVVIWGLHLWKCCVLVLVIFCGRLYTRWMMITLLFLIRRKWLLNEKVLYFVYGVRISVRFFAWLCLVLLAWIFLVDRGVQRTGETMVVLHHIKRALASSLVGAAIWLLKTLFVKVIAANFQGKRFFDRIKEAIFHQHVLEVLSLPESASRAKSTSTSIASMTRRKSEKVITWLKNMKKEKASAWTMKGFIDVISGSKLSFAEDEDNDHKQKDKKITSELKVKQAANKLFKKLAKSDRKCIQKKDLLSYFDEKELDEDVLPLFKRSPETEEIKKKALKDWMLEVYRERKSLVCSLKDSKTAIEELNRLASGVVLIVIIIVWLLLMGFLTTKVLLFISSQLLLAAFMFGKTLRTVFEAIIFVFVVHPFDVSDRCIIDGAQMIVEEVNLLSTVFLKFDNEKVYYPNSVLATKPIGNFYRSPEMGDSVEFAIDVSTSVEQIKALKVKIKEYLENNPATWHSEHSVVVKDFDDVNKIKMVLFVKHTINFQNYADKSNRRSDLILELKTMLEDLHIKYHMLPLQAHLIGSHFPPTTR